MDASARARTPARAAWRRKHGGNRSDAAALETSAAILITIDASDTIVIDGRQVDARLVRANVEHKHAADPDQGVVIKPLPGSTAQRLVAVIAARQARVFDIALARDD